MRSTPVGVRDAADIEQRITAFVREQKGALIVLAASVTIQHRQSIITAAARQRVRAVDSFRLFTVNGDLCHTGPRTARRRPREGFAVRLRLRRRLAEAVCGFGARNDDEAKQK